MKPVWFSGANREFICPDVENCESLFAWAGNNLIISCWKLSFRERLSAFLFGTVWVTLLSQNAPPPMALDAKRDVFVRQEK